MTSITKLLYLFFFQAEDGIRDPLVTGVQTCALPISPPSAVRRAWSPDEVRLVHHAAGETAADADEDTLVQPRELAGRGLDLRGGAKGVLARIDILAAAETFENLGSTVAHAT